MVQQKISIDPELWARTRRKAFDLKTTASKLVEEGLSQYLDQLDIPGEMREPRERLATATATATTATATTTAPPPHKTIGLNPTGQRAVDQLRSAPWNDPVPVAVAESAGSVAIAPSANNEKDGFGAAAVVVPDGASKIINDPQVAAAMATQRAQLAGRTIHPVPKPEKKPTRRR